MCGKVFHTVHILIHIFSRIVEKQVVKGKINFIDFTIFFVIMKFPVKNYHYIQI